MAINTGTVLFAKTARRLDRKRLRAFHGLLSVRVAKAKAFNCLITGDADLLRLNTEFLGRDYPADVLSFPDLPGEGSLGEIAISADRATDQASEYNHDIETEIEILMLHGLLHLMGLDHESDRGAMRRTEVRWRKLLGLPAGLIERTR